MFAPDPASPPGSPASAAPPPLAEPAAKPRPGGPTWSREHMASAESAGLLIRGLVLNPFINWFDD